MHAFLNQKNDKNLEKSVKTASKSKFLVLGKNQPGVLESVQVTPFLGAGVQFLLMKRLFLVGAPNRNTIEKQMTNIHTHLFPTAPAASL